MINAMETATSQPYSLPVRRQTIARDALTFFPTAKVRDGAPDASYRPPLPSPNSFGRVNTAPTERATAAVSQAQSVVAAQVEEASLETPVKQASPSRGEVEILAMDTSSATEKGFEFPKLDASWKIIPTARFNSDANQRIVELRV